MMLVEEQNYRAARNQFKAGARADAYHLPVWQAWAVMEGSLGNYEEARSLFQRGVWAAPKNPDIVYLWQVGTSQHLPLLHVCYFLPFHAGNSPADRSIDCIRFEPTHPGAVGKV